MDSRRALQIALDSLARNKLRTFQTMLGVIIGVAAVVAMVSIGAGAKKEVLEQISLLGIHNVIVNARVPDAADGSLEGAHSSGGLSLDDAHNLAGFTDLVVNVVPLRYEAVGTVRHGARAAAVRVVATTPNFARASCVGVESGRFLLPGDDEMFAQVCVLGAKAKRELFGTGDPLGASIHVGGLDFTVVGVMADRYIGRGKVEGLELKNFNEDVYIPLRTAQKKLERSGPMPAAGESGFAAGHTRVSQFAVPELDQITVTAAGLGRVPAVAKVVERVLARRHGDVDDYDIVVPESLLRQSLRTQRIFRIVLGTIAGLSLLMGGIGIMNIMLATVLERTPEIGVRRAVGARRRDILLQFLAEAVTICLCGCSIGLGLGLGISRTISIYARAPTVISAGAILLAIGVSTLVGIVFGLVPAAKAARVDVIESLRYE